MLRLIIKFVLWGLGIALILALGVLFIYALSQMECNCEDDGTRVRYTLMPIFNGKGVSFAMMPSYYKVDVKKKCKENHGRRET